MDNKEIARRLRVIASKSAYTDTIEELYIIANEFERQSINTTHDTEFIPQRGQPFTSSAPIYRADSDYDTANPKEADNG